MIKKTIWIGLTLSVLGFLSPIAVRGDDLDKKMVLTFSQPVEIPGHVLPAGTYTFKLANLMTDRHIVQIFNSESQILATVLAIPHYRATTTGQAIVTFNEVPTGSPEAIRAWFYPGSTLGQEFVYPKPRATELAKAAKVAVPALTVEVADIDTLKTAPIVAITPDEKEVPSIVAIQTRRVETMAMAGTSGVMQTTQSITQTAQNPTQLPRTAGVLTLIMFLGLGSIGIAFCLILFGRPANAYAGI